jgi:hypothetical protein
MDDVKVEAREPYEQPTVEDVPLRAEEQVLQNCKAFAGGPGMGFSCLFPAPCNSGANS